MLPRWSLPQFTEKPSVDMVWDTVSATDTQAWDTATATTSTTNSCNRCTRSLTPIFLHTHTHLWTVRIRISRTDSVAKVCDMLKDLTWINCQNQSNSESKRATVCTSFHSFLNVCLSALLWLCGWLIFRYKVNLGQSGSKFIRHISSQFKRRKPISWSDGPHWRTFKNSDGLHLSNCHLIDQLNRTHLRVQILQQVSLRFRVYLVSNSCHLLHYAAVVCNLCTCCADQWSHPQNNRIRFGSGQTARNNGRFAHARFALNVESFLLERSELRIKSS